MQNRELPAISARFFNEFHVNKKVLPLEYPVIFAHEKAHQFGVTAESEANFYAWLVCRQSDSQVLNYSANLFILRYFFSQASAIGRIPKVGSQNRSSSSERF